MNETLDILPIFNLTLNLFSYHILLIDIKCTRNMPACNTVLALVLAHDIHLIISGFILQPEVVISC